MILYLNFDCNVWIFHCMGLNLVSYSDKSITDTRFCLGTGFCTIISRKPQQSFHTVCDLHLYRCFVSYFSQKVPSTDYGASSTFYLTCYLYVHIKIKIKIKDWEHDIVVCDNFSPFFKTRLWFGSLCVAASQCCLPVS